MKDPREFFLGVILSFTSWETWENIFVSLLVAFLGGVLAAAGKAMYGRISHSLQVKKSQKHKIT